MYNKAECTLSQIREPAQATILCTWYILGVLYYCIWYLARDYSEVRYDIYFVPGTRYAQSYDTGYLVDSSTTSSAQAAGAVAYNDLVRLVPRI